MKILTFNLWHGKGQKRFGLEPLEPPGHKDARMDGFLGLAREARPDIIFLQEADPAPDTARRIAAELQMDEIHQVSNAGIKIVVGIPRSFRSGLIILARRELGLRKLGAIKIPGSGWGWCWDRVSLQVREHRYALFGRIERDATPMVLAVTHLHHTRALDDPARAWLGEAERTGTLSAEEHQKLLNHNRERVDRRAKQVRAIADYLEKHAPGLPAILGGDFNAEPDTGEIRDLVGARGFIDTYAETGVPPGNTWDPRINTNTSISSGTFLDVDSSCPEVQGLMQEQDMREGRIDYIFLNRAFTSDRILSSELFAASPLPDGLYCSDHFGVLTSIRF